MGEGLIRELYRLLNSLVVSGQMGKGYLREVCMKATKKFSGGWLKINIVSVPVPL